MQFSELGGIARISPPGYAPALKHVVNRKKIL